LFNSNQYVSNLELCRLNLKQCKTCLNFHYISFALNSSTKLRKFYDHCLSSKYFQFTTETLVETRLLDSLLADIMFKQSSFRAFCDSYNFMHANPSQKRYYLNGKRIADIFYAYEILKFFNEHKFTQPLEG